MTTTEELRAVRDGELRHLHSLKRQFQAQLNDTEDRIALLEKQYLPQSDDYVERVASEIGGNTDLLKAAHQNGHLILGGRLPVDMEVAREFQRRYEEAKV